jgi:hypothetical protein
MNKLNQDKLLNDFPELYKQYYLPMSETCMCWGFDCGDGWFDLIYKLSTNISKIDPTCEAVQVKEKFGGLRFYISKGNNELYELINNAEKESFKTCEICGNPGILYNKDNWMIIRCEDHKEIKRRVKE